MPRTSIVMLSGTRYETEMSRDALYILFNEIKARRVGSISPILVEVFDESKKGYVDIRKIDPDATFTPSVSAKESIAA